MDVIKYLKDNIKGIFIEESLEDSNIYYATTIKSDYEIKMQIEFYDDLSFCCLTCWMLDSDDIQVTEDVVIYDENEIELILEFVNTIPKIYNKVTNNLNSLIELCNDNNLDIEQILSSML